METIVGAVDTLEKTLLPLGLMTGDYAIPKRMLLGAALGGFLVTWVKPTIMFAPDGTARPWMFLGGNGPETTSFPWFFVPIIFAVLLGVFI